MGKSIDLPDPLESTARPLGNADDLLAQLAGEEVDRLLAEAESESKPPRPGEARRSGDAPPADEPQPEAPIQDQLDALFGEISAERPATPEPPGPGVAPDASAAPVPPAVAPIAPAPLAPITSKLPDDIDANEVMAAILGNGNAAAPTHVAPLKPGQPLAPSTPPPAAATVAAAARPPTSAELAVIAEPATTAAERSALSAPADPADELPGPGELEALTSPIETDDAAPLPVYLKPLEWLNAPLEKLPPAFRDVIGQIAILTLINAMAVLIYVFLFRGKP